MASYPVNREVPPKEFSTDRPRCGGDGPHHSDAVRVTIDCIELGQLVLTLRCPPPLASTTLMALQPVPDPPKPPDRKRELSIDERRDLAQARRLVKTVLMATLEVAAGRRPVCQLEPRMGRRALRQVLALATQLSEDSLADPRGLVSATQIHLDLPTPGRIEAVVCLPTSAGVRALSISLRVAATAKWCCTGLRLVA